VIPIGWLSKRDGWQMLFLEASAVVNRGGEVGLVGPVFDAARTLHELEQALDDPARARCPPISASKRAGGRRADRAMPRFDELREERHGLR
jgi:hypothetical protein